MQGAVGGSFNIHLTANLLRNLPVIFFLNRLRSDRIMVMSLWPRFLGPPCTVTKLPASLKLVAVTSGGSTGERSLPPPVQRPEKYF